MKTNLSEIHTKNSLFVTEPGQDNETVKSAVYYMRLNEVKLSKNQSDLTQFSEIAKLLFFISVQYVFC